MVLRQILEHLGVRGIVSALRLFEAGRGQAELVEQDARELHGARKVELLAAGELANTRLERLNLTDELIRLCGEASRVDVHARALHGGEDAYERHLNLGEDGIRPLGFERRGEWLAQGAGEPGPTCGDARCVRRGTVLPRRRRQGRMQVGLGQVGVGEVRAHRIEQICGDHGIEQASRIHRQGVKQLGFTRIDRRQLVEQRLGIGGSNAPLGQDELENARDDTCGKIEISREYRTGAEGLLERQQGALGGDPQAARHAEKRVGLLVVLHGHTEPLARLERTGQLVETRAHLLVLASVLGLIERR